MSPVVYSVVVFRNNTVYVHPVPFDASDSDERLHRPGHNILRLCHGAQRVHLAAGEDERGEGAGTAAARAVCDAARVVPQHQHPPQPAEPVARQQLQPQLPLGALAAPDPQQRAVHSAAVHDDTAPRGHFELVEDFAPARD